MRTVKVEITKEDGSVLRVVGDEANKWQDAVNGQAMLCMVHGVNFPELKWENTPVDPKVRTALERGRETLHKAIAERADMQGLLVEAMKALAHHNGRSWCAVCGYDNLICNMKTPDCIGARARKMYPKGG